MKKFKIVSLVLLLVVSITAFTGCLFSNSASMKDCYDLYSNTNASLKEENDVKFETMSLQIDETDNVEKNYSSLDIIEFNYSTSLTTWLDRSSNSYRVLLSDFTDIQKYAFTAFCYYKPYLVEDIINNKIDQKYKKEIYTAIEDYKTNVQKFLSTKKSIEDNFVGNIMDNTDTANIINQKLNGLVATYIDITECAVRVGENTMSAITAFNPITLEKDTVINDYYARVAVLSTLTYNTKILLNYYKQYIELNGVTQFTQISTSYNNLKNNCASLYSNIKSGKLIFKNEGTGFNKVAVEDTIKLLPDLQLTASQVKMLSDKLEDKHYSDKESDENYNYEKASLEKTFNIILDRSSISEINSKALSI